MKKVIFMNKAVYPIGTVHTWNGKDYVKISSSDWKPTATEKKRQQTLKTLKTWATQKNFDNAKGKDFEKIKAMYGNELQPIAVLSNNVKNLLGAKSNEVKCGKAYFIDHMVNHHPEVKPKEYLKLQNRLDNYNIIYFNQERNSYVFETKTNKGMFEYDVIEKKKDTFILYKTFYKHLRQKFVNDEKYIKISLKKGLLSSEDALISISQVEKSTPGSTADISALQDNNSIPQNIKKSICFVKNNRFYFRKSKGA